ncbi:GvpL/GvpF family gas vesicle protein [Mycobacterium sp.]|jgi:hypothetical protein|uniref:GvpL/GvpF family gas vesicle protein n=1 Tax=Mycobacterium sp. TaxID=1785 RepID=UPI002D53A144|nr:GvpL/GvpF family gas vesicle protein [Mycobacterium sp.]HZA09829.1 GvpL/GvpF family gas vesicle protein [Mycobacterium sp.]
MTSSQLEDQDQQDQDVEPRTAIYVYGIVPGDVEVEEDAQGIGDPPAKVDVVREGEIAALVSPVPSDRALGSPEDLRGHAKLLDGTASVAPVLPLRFGAVMSDAESVAGELLREHHDEFAQALSALEGSAEYIVKGRYDEEALLVEVLSESERARALLEDIRNKPEELSRNSQIALGELIANAIELKRRQDTATVVDAVGELASAVNVREPTHEYDAVHVAVLARVDSQSELETVSNRLADAWGERVSLRLLGPLAAYDFVVTTRPPG